MKLVQLNFWQGRLMPRALDLLKDEKPDIVCLQEVTSSDIGSNGFLETNNLQKLLKELALPYHFLAPRFSYQLMHTKAQYGNCILSRLPIVSKETRFTYGDFAEDLVLDGKNHNMANAQLAVIEIGEQSLNIINHHGYYQPQPNGNQITIEALQKVADWTSNLSGPVILAGDFNIWPKSPALEAIEALGLKNLIQEHNIRSTLSELHEAPSKNDIACDYIFCSDDLKIRDFRVSDKIVSDHKALILDFDI